MSEAVTVPPTSGFRVIGPGDPAPWFTAACTSSPTYKFDTVAGRFIVLAFVLTTRDAVGTAMMKVLTEHRRLFDDDRICFFGVSVDPSDRDEGRMIEAMPGIRHFWDFDGAVSRLFGALPADATAGRQLPGRRFYLVVSPSLRVHAVVPVETGEERHRLVTILKTLPPVDQVMGFPVAAPVLFVPDVLEPELCRRLIDLYEANGGVDSGFMKEIDGKTVSATDYRHKKREDYTIEDPALIRLLQAKVQRRVVPEIEKVHQFKVTRMERYIVGCYDAADGGHFRAHRDNTTKGTAHRRFALSINLNSEFEGGRVSFPEYGPTGYKVPAGSAVVFSCSLLHAVSKVTAGRRYAFLPFLYDDAAAAIRERNNAFLGEGVVEYRPETAVKT